ncbi:SAR1012 family small protein [Staphylococcus simiae]|nr:SAR1012 family small protein [Staphylococcus simiae]
MKNIIKRIARILIVGYVVKFIRNKMSSNKNQ